MLCVDLASDTALRWVDFLQAFTGYYKGLRCAPLTFLIMSLLVTPGPWRFPGAVKYPQDFNPGQSRSYAIWDYVACVRHNELASSMDAAWMSECRIVSQKTHSIIDSTNHQPRRLGVIFCNEAGFLVEVLQSCGQPLNLHLLPTSQRFALPHHHWQIRPHRPLLTPVVFPGPAIR